MSDNAQTFTITWTIDVVAETALEAAERAIEIMRDRDSMATVFDVMDENDQIERIDLLALCDAV